jgi:hypothetical protein
VRCRIEALGFLVAKEKFYRSPDGLSRIGLNCNKLDGLCGVRRSELILDIASSLFGYRPRASFSGLPMLSSVIGPTEMFGTFAISI